MDLLTCTEAILPGFAITPAWGTFPGAINSTDAAAIPQS